MADIGALSECLARYSREIATQLQAGRKHLAKHFPRGFELVYDSYNALGFGFAHGNRASDVVISVVGYPRWVTLFFLYGVNLRDPNSILVGTGARVRSVRLDPFARLESAAVQALIAATKQQFASQFAVAPALTTVFKSQASKQRPRRPQGKSSVAAAGKPKKRGG
jgi:hypothetical protein